MLTGSGVRPGLVDAIVGAARDRGGPAVATADARRALRESYRRNQETLRQLELDLRPAPLPCPVTGAGPVVDWASGAPVPAEVW